MPISSLARQIRDFPLTRNRLFCIIILLTSLAIYSGGWSNDFLINWDDAAYVTDNPDIRAISLENLKNIFTKQYLGVYSPVHVLSYMLDYALWGLHPRGYLLVNVLLHGLSGVLFYRLLLRLGFSTTGALFAALLFTAHPVQVESVAWISQRKSVLSLTFLLAAFWQYLDYCEERQHRWRHYALALGFFLLALLTKLVMVILPGLLLSYDLLLRERGREFLKVVAEKVPFALLGLVVVWHAVVDDDNPAPALVGGTVSSEVMTMLTIFKKYLGIIFWPFRLSAEYQVDIRYVLDAEVVMAAFLLALSLGAVWLVARAQRRGAIFCLSVMVIGLLPVAQLVPFLHLMYDRYLYIPMLGFSAGLVLLLDSWIERLRIPARAVLVCACIVLVLLAVASWQRTGVWANALTLWQDAAAKEPGAPDAWFSLGTVHDINGNIPAAIASYQKALELNPDYYETHFNLASSYLKAYEYDAALRHFRKSLELMPDSAAALRNLGLIHMVTGDNRAAVATLTRALQTDPANLQLQVFLGANWYYSGNLPAALQCFEEVRRNGGSAEFSAIATSMLALMAMHQGEPTAGSRFWQEARALGVTEAEIYVNWARLEAIGHNRPKALEYLHKAVALGFKDFPVLCADPVFWGLHSDADFVRLVKP